MLIYLHSAAPVVSISCHQYWPYKDFQKLASFISYPKNDRSKIGHKSHRWELDVSVMEGKIENWTLLSWYWSMNSPNNKRFGYSQLKTHLFHPGFSAKTLTKHLQLHLLYPSNSEFENDIGRALGPNGLVWSSDSLYSWSNKSCCSLWGQTPHVYNLPNSDAMF